LVLGDDVMCDLRVSGQPLTTDGNVCPHSLSRVFLMFECFSLLRVFLLILSCVVSLSTVFGQHLAKCAFAVC
jgi:hypothetical protein